MATGSMVPMVIRLTPADAKLLDALALELHAARPGTVALALRHLAESMDRGQPVYPRHQSVYPRRKSVHPTRKSVSGIDLINTPPPGIGRVLDGNKARVQERMRERQGGR